MVEIKAGDVVCLKSKKSIKMTVRWVHQKEKESEILEACCDWFLDDKTLRQQVFPVTSLTTETN